MVPEAPVEQLVEFSIDLVDPGYRELLDDPDSPQYVDLAHHLQDQVSLLSAGLCPFDDCFIFMIVLIGFPDKRDNSATCRDFSPIQNVPCPHESLSTGVPFHMSQSTRPCP